MTGDHISVDRVTAFGGLDLVTARFRTKSTALHSHPELEIGVVVSGRRLVRCRDRVHRVRAGAIVVFRPGEIHAGAPLDRKGSTYRSFLIPIETLGALGCGWHCTDRVIEDRAVSAELVAIHVELEDTGATVELERRLQSVLDRLLRRPGPVRPRTDETRYADVVARVRAYLETHYRSAIRLETLAQVAGLSVYRLIRLFRAANGVPPYAYLEQVRVNRAAELLRAGHPVARVALLTRFADQSHLTRFFKRLVGVPPGRYQRSALRAASDSHLRGGHDRSTQLSQILRERGGLAGTEPTTRIRATEQRGAAA